MFLHAKKRFFSHRHDQANLCVSSHFIPDSVTYLRIDISPGMTEGQTNHLQTRSAFAIFPGLIYSARFNFI
ncbi:MAG: hypothetical protein DRH32_09410 [Deltaproteobacteria bacterium]|nr:MAG: hypothetical protein DRH32_09410 [Deltaproteobacteria bacterium]